jgi:hypothetical protein
MWETFRKEHSVENGIGCMGSAIFQPLFVQVTEDTFSAPEAVREAVEKLSGLLS